MLQRPGIATSIPSYLLTAARQDLACQAAKWTATKKWSGWLPGYPAVLEALKDETRDHGGSIRREFVHSYSDRNAVELFYVAIP